MGIGLTVVEKEVEGEIRFVVDLPNLPTIYWTPDGSQLPDLPSSLPNPQSDDANQPRIFINPIPQADAQGEKLEGMPIPDQPTFKDFILVFPDGFGIKPFYIALAESGEFGGEVGNLIKGFNQIETKIINETQGILDSKTLSQIKQAHKTG